MRQTSALSDGCAAKYPKSSFQLSAVSFQLFPGNANCDGIRTMKLKAES
jgi:hypothetical protein